MLEPKIFFDLKMQPKNLDRLEIQDIGLKGSKMTWVLLVNCVCKFSTNGLLSLLITLFYVPNKKNQNNKKQIVRQS